MHRMYVDIKPSPTGTGSESQQRYIGSTSMCSLRRRSSRAQTQRRRLCAVTTTSWSGGCRWPVGRGACAHRAYAASIGRSVLAHAPVVSVTDESAMSSAHPSGATTNAGAPEHYLLYAHVWRRISPLCGVCVPHRWTDRIPRIALRSHSTRYYRGRAITVDAKRAARRSDKLHDRTLASTPAHD